MLAVLGNVGVIVWVRWVRHWYVGSCWKGIGLSWGIDFTPGLQGSFVVGLGGESFPPW